MKDIVTEGLIIKNPRTPRFYKKSKIHKEETSGRPVTSSINCHTLHFKFFSSHSNFKQFYIKLKTLSTNQRLCNWGHLCIILRKYAHGSF